MVSVLIKAGAGEGERLAHTLASLIPAAVEGLVREVVVIAPAQAGDVAGVAEHAGCRLAATAAEAIGAARGDWLLCLEPGARLREGWSEAVTAHVAALGAGAARFTPDVPWWRAWAVAVRRGRPLARGLLIPRRAAASLAQAGGDPLARPPRTQRLGARLLPPR